WWSDGQSTRRLAAPGMLPRGRSLPSIVLWLDRRGGLSSLASGQHCRSSRSSQSRRRSRPVGGGPAPGGRLRGPLPHGGGRPPALGRRQAAAAAAGGVAATPAVLQGGVSVELVHLGSLYHDDVMDEAASRRGVESVNARWGNLVAILAGDFLLARASEIA